MNKRVMKFMIALLSLLLLVGVGIFQFNLRREKPLRLITVVKGDNVGDITTDGFMLLSSNFKRQITDVRYYQWDGKSTWGFTIPGENETLYNNEHTWGFSDYDWFHTWKSADYPRYHFSNKFEMDDDNRVKGYLYNSFVRFSPDGKSVGAISYLSNRLYVSLWENGQCRWKTNLPIAANGKIDGSKFIDLLVTNKHEILLYIKIIKERKERPIIMLNHNGKEIEANLLHEYRNAIEAYVKAIPVPKQRHTQAWSIPSTTLERSPDQNTLERSPYRKILASSPYRQFVLDAQEDINKDTLSLKVYAYPQIQKASIRGKIIYCDDYRFVKLEIPDHADFKYAFEYNSQKFNTTQFSPDGQHLLLCKMYGGAWGIFEW